MSFIINSISDAGRRFRVNLFTSRHCHQIVGVAALCFALALSSSPAFSQPQPVNINAASPELLSEGLAGVGLAKAYRIVEHRESYGPFESIDELIEVKGIGDSIIARNRDRIVLE